jgi:hypothetical protein
MKKYFEITVVGKGNFPLDMLRHSQCWPVDAEAVEAIADRARYDSPRTARLGMIGHYAQADACAKRFASFLWTAEITMEESL